MCEPEVSVVSFESSEFNVLNLLDDMATKGWTLTALQTPPGFVLCHKFNTNENNNPQISSYWRV